MYLKVHSSIKSIFLSQASTSHYFTGRVFAMIETDAFWIWEQSARSFLNGKLFVKSYIFFVRILASCHPCISSNLSIFICSLTLLSQQHLFLCIAVLPCTAVFRFYNCSTAERQHFLAYELPGSFAK